jgi:hypothetical protein
MKRENVPTWALFCFELKSRYPETEIRGPARTILPRMQIISKGGAVSRDKSGWKVMW